MSEPVAEYLMISLPTSCGSKQSTCEWLERDVNSGKVELHELKLPNFKVGTLDSLVLQSEELSKIDHQLHQSITKVLDIMYNLLNNNNQGLKLPRQKIDGQFVEQFFENFNWKQSRYRLDKSIEELIKLISNEALQLDGDLKTQYAAYNTAKSNLLSCQRKQTGDLSVKSLHDVVKKENFVLDSDHLITILLAIPKSLKSQFLNNYETISPFIVPRSAEEISSDSEYYLFGVTLFKKYEQEFLTNARENKWIPRDFEYSDEAIEKMKNEFEVASKAELNLKNDLIRLSREAYAEITSSWIHIKLLRTFVESVLRYGLPPDFYCYILKFPDLKSLDNGKNDCIERFGYLGGNAFATDKNGKVVKDQSLHEYAALVDQDYEPFVLYQVDLY